MNFKSERIQDEWDQLAITNPRLRTIVEMAERYTLMEWGYTPTITSILRTKAEHDALYSKTPADKRPASSPHMTWSGVDLRTKDLTEDKINKLVTFLNCFTVYDGKKKCALYHEITGGAKHLHLQCPSKGIV